VKCCYNDTRAASSEPTAASWAARPSRATHAAALIAAARSHCHNCASCQLAHDRLLLRAAAMLCVQNTIHPANNTHSKQATTAASVGWASAAQHAFWLLCCAHTSHCLLHASHDLCCIRFCSALYVPPCWPQPRRPQLRPRLTHGPTHAPAPPANKHYAHLSLLLLLLLRARARPPTGPRRACRCPGWRAARWA
jgi:hypothetical protein